MAALEWIADVRSERISTESRSANGQRRSFKFLFVDLRLKHSDEALDLVARAADDKKDAVMQKMYEGKFDGLFY